MTWQTRQLATFTAGGYMVDAKTGNPAIAAAQTLAFDEIEKAQIEEAENRSSPENNRGGLVYGKDEHGRDAVIEIIPDMSNVKVGSFEQFLGSAGNPYRWAGR